MGYRKGLWLEDVIDAAPAFQPLTSDNSNQRLLSVQILVRLICVISTIGVYNGIAYAFLSFVPSARSFP